MADTEQKMYRTVYIQKNQWGKLSGSMSWDGEKLYVRNIDQNGTKFVGDVVKKTGEKYVDNAGKERERVEIVGAIRWDTDPENNIGEYVTEIDGIMAKFQLKNSVEETKFGPARILRAVVSRAEDTKWRRAFDAKDTMVVTGEMPTTDMTDEVPFQ